MKNKNKKNPTFFLLITMAFCALLFLECKPSSGGSVLEPLKVTIFKVGKADAIVLQTGERAMVIDAGEEEDGEEVVQYLNNQGITSLDALIITHYDQDHVGGADTLVEAMNVKKVLLPDYQGNSTEYADFMDALKEKDITPQNLTKNESFKFGEANVLVEPPLTYEVPGKSAEVDNNFSLITTVTHGENKLLFTGDAEKHRIREWVGSGRAQKCDFMKVPHHGVYNKALRELIDATAPKYAVICSSNKNPADVQTLELLKSCSIDTLQTKDGNVTVISDGSDLEIHQELEK